MYLVKIINNEIETIINNLSTRKEANRISGIIKQGINCINSFTFTIYPNNEGYNLIQPYKTLVTVLNMKTNKYEFRGRVLQSSGSMSDVGVVSKTFICESELGFLCDSIQVYRECHNFTPTDYLKLLVENHNKNLENEKNFQVGDVTVTDPNDSVYRYVAYDTTWKNINEDLIGTLGGELQVRHENSRMYLDYLTEIGRTCNTEIRLGRNIRDIEKNEDVTNFYTRLVPLGAKKKIVETDEEGNEEEVELEERLTIEEINNGLNYIDDEDGIKKFGIIQGVVFWDSVTDVTNLLRKGKEYLSSQKITVNNKINALDLSLIGLDIDSFEVGNWYPLKHELLNLDYSVRVIEKSINIENPHETTITLGDKEKDIKHYQLEGMQATKEVETLRITTENINNSVKNISKNLGGTTETVEGLYTTTQELGTTTQELYTTTQELNSRSINIQRRNYMEV